MQEPEIEAAFAKIREEHGCVVKSKEVIIIITYIINIIIIIMTKVKALVQGRDRRPELAYKLALECRSILIIIIIIITRPKPAFSRLGPGRSSGGKTLGVSLRLTSRLRRSARL